MPSFDVVSEIEHFELTNAVDQANRELAARYDFKGVDAEFSLDKNAVKMSAESEFQLQQMHDILSNKITKRQLDPRCLKASDIETSGLRARQNFDIMNGLDKDTAKKISKDIKTQGFKVKTSIMDDKVRVDGKKRDDLQQVITWLKQSDCPVPLQYNNFRD